MTCMNLLHGCMTKNLPFPRNTRDDSMLLVSKNTRPGYKVISNMPLLWPRAPQRSPSTPVALRSGQNKLNGELCSSKLSTEKLFTEPITLTVVGFASPSKLTEICLLETNLRWEPAKLWQPPVWSSTLTGCLIRSLLGRFHILSRGKDFISHAQFFGF
jgi:hypothetical protein